jgi:hypothetical protein
MHQFLWVSKKFKNGRKVHKDPDSNPDSNVAQWEIGLGWSSVVKIEKNGQKIVKKHG